MGGQKTDRSGWCLEFFRRRQPLQTGRWCSMDGCGNRAKAARFRLAHRK
ncbi:MULTISPECIES: CGNR zinc finger domain-containing protein [Mesorhizobium]